MRQSRHSGQFKAVLKTSCDKKMPTRKQQEKAVQRAARSRLQARIETLFPTVVQNSKGAILESDFVFTKDALGALKEVSVKPCKP